MTRYRVAALQMNSNDNLGDNLRLADNLLSDAARRRCRLAILPENFALMGLRDEDKVAIAEPVGEGLVHDFLADAARRHQMWIIAGSVPRKGANPDLCFGTSVVYDDKGDVQASYDKIHLFDVDLPNRDEHYRESATMERGNKTVVVESPLGRIGLSICYDLRFPELYRKLVDSGAIAFSVPAAFTDATGHAHWHSLLRCRAIENLAYVVASAQTGSHANGRKTFGHSMIVDPWGQILTELESGNGIAMAELDTRLPAELRRQFPVLEHRRVT